MLQTVIREARHVFNTDDGRGGHIRIVIHEEEEAICKKHLLNFSRRLQTWSAKHQLSMLSTNVPDVPGMSIKSCWSEIGTQGAIAYASACR